MSLLCNALMSMLRSASAQSGGFGGSHTGGVALVLQIRLHANQGHRIAFGAAPKPSTRIPSSPSGSRQR